MTTSPDDGFKTPRQCHEIAAGMGITVSTQAIAAAARRGAFEGATQYSGHRVWRIPQDKFIEWLGHRQPRGRKSAKRG